MDDSLLVAVHLQHALVSVRGRGTFKQAPALKRFATTAIDGGVQDVVVDLGRCDSMDSTFMGVLAGLAIRLRREGRGHVCTVNHTPRTRALIEQLGLDQLLDCRSAHSGQQLIRAVWSGASPDELPPLPAGERDTLTTMLEAHEDLVDACPENLVKFTDVITYLKQAQRDLGD